MSVYFVKVHGDWLLLWSSILRQGGARGDLSVHVCNCAMFIFFVLYFTRKSASACLLLDYSCASCMRPYVHGDTLRNTCTHVWEIKSIAMECVLVPHAVCVGGRRIYVLCKRIFSLGPVAKT